MHTVSVYGVEASSDGLGDVGQLQQKTGVLPTSASFLSFYIGSQFDGTSDRPQQGFWRFEVDMPAGSTIIGVKFEATAFSAGTLGPIDMYGGFLKQQDTAFAWEDADGCHEWLTLDTHIPLVDYNSFVGIQHDEIVFWGGSAGFPRQALQVVGSGMKWSIGEGTFTGNSAADVAGLITQLQGYLDDPGNEATRGLTKAGAIPVMFTVLRDFVGLRDQSQELDAQDSITALKRPTLTLEYKEDIGGQVEAESDVVAYAKGRGEVGPVIVSASSVRSLVGVDPGVGSLIVGVPDVTEEVD